MMRALPRKLSTAPIVVAVAALGLSMATPTTAQTILKRLAPPIVTARQSNDAHNRDVRIHNQTGWPMTRLYASSGAGWGPDLLGAGVLSPGRSLVVRLDDGAGGCRYALRAEFENGQNLERSGVNACQIADYYFTR